MINNLNILKNCRGCDSDFLSKVWKSPPLPIHLWPIHPDAETSDQKTTVFVCENCGLAQLNDMSVKFVEHLYSEGVCVLDEQGSQPLRKSLITSWGGENFFNGKTVLELGGGNNPFISVLPEAKEKWVADLSPNEDIFKIADNVIEGNFETIVLPEKNFDVICGFLIYEHFVNPLQVTKQIVKSLSDDGYLIVEVPNLHWLHSELPHYMVFHQHQSIFTLGTLNFMMATAGLKCASVFAENHVVYAAFQKDDTVQPIIEKDETETNKRKVLETGRLLNSIDDYVCNHTPLNQAKNSSIYGAGGSMSLFLAYTNKFRSKLKFAFDIDKRKQGKYVPGTKAVVMAPKEMDTYQLDIGLVISDQLSEVAVKDKINKKITITAIISNLLHPNRGFSNCD